LLPFAACLAVPAQARSENFIVRVPDSVDLLRYNIMVVWCETFSMFISAARYR